MTAWDDFDKMKKAMQQRRRIASFLFFAFALITVTAVLFSVWAHKDNNVTSTASTYSTYTVIGDTANTNSVSSIAVTPATLTRESINLSLVPHNGTGGLSSFSSFFEDPVVFSESKPTFVLTGNKERSLSKPLSLMLDDEVYELGMASVGATTVAGAAGEWRVRPWWMPGWIPDSDDCGSGTTIIAGHVSWYGRPGPFHELGTTEVGDTVACQKSNGEWVTYHVSFVGRTTYTDVFSYRTPPTGTTGENILILYSCTPEIDGLVIVKAVTLEDKSS